MSTPTFRKERAGAPPGYFAWEAAGLRWLGDAAPSGGAAVGQIVEVDEHSLVLVRIDPVTPTVADAEALGRSLARTHAAGAPAHGSGPEGWTGDGFLGPLSEPLPLVLAPCEDWGTFYAEQRILATLDLGISHGCYSSSDIPLFERVATRVAAGDLAPQEAPARLHGDLWSGNVMWGRSGAVLIDPAAHGGHRETDLAMLALFGAPHLGRLLAAYDEAAPLAEGWQDRVVLHQLHPLMIHAVLFGGSYVERSREAARHYR